MKQEYEKYTGSKPILVVCTDEKLLEMKNETKFSTGNHPVEMFLPMLHFREAGFTFEFATLSGGSVKLEMWAYPKEDENVKSIYEENRSKMDSPKKLADISSLDDYSAIFIPGGHGSVINLPTSKDLGRLLHQAHDQEMPTVTLCHGPSALLSTEHEETGKKFPYSGYKMMCFSDKTDKLSPTFGYMPGHMPWYQQEKLAELGVIDMNTKESGEVTKDRELFTGDSPDAADNLGKLAAPFLVKYAMENKL